MDGERLDSSTKHAKNTTVVRLKPRFRTIEAMSETIAQKTTPLLPGYLIKCIDSPENAKSITKPTAQL